MTDISEMLATIPPHRMEWRARLIDFLLPRLNGTAQEKELALDMVFAATQEAANEGVQDCADVVTKLANAATGDRHFVLKTVEKALLEMHRLNALRQAT